MIGFFSPDKEDNSVIKKGNLYFVSVPDGLPPSEIKDRFAKTAKAFANQIDSNKVYLIYGKEEIIEYDYE